MDAGLGFGQGAGQIVDGGGILGQQMIGQPLGGLAANGGQTGQLADEVFDQGFLGIGFGHRNKILIIPGPVAAYGPILTSKFARMVFSGARIC